MRFFCIFLALLLLGAACAEESLELADTAPMEKFAARYADGLDFSSLLDSAADGEIDGEAIVNCLKAQAAQPLREAISDVSALIAPTALLAVMSCLAGSGGARFAARLALLLGMGKTAMRALNAAQSCLEMIGAFSDVISPALAALLSASGLTSSAAMLSPAAALVGNLSERAFLRFGLPLCGAALAAALAGSLSPSIELGRIVKLLRKLVGWGAGLCFTLFTALIALQGNLSATMDGVVLRTAKYAVDSAAPVIGSGVSDAWEAYVSGVLAAKSAVGVSGVLALLAAGAMPMLRVLLAVLLLQVISALLDVLGEKAAAQAASRTADVCQMALEMCTSALAIGTILLGAAISAGSGLAR